MPAGHYKVCTMLGLYVLKIVSHLIWNGTSSLCILLQSLPYRQMLSTCSPTASWVSSWGEVPTRLEQCMTINSRLQYGYDFPFVLLRIYSEASHNLQDILLKQCYQCMLQLQVTVTSLHTWCKVHLYPSFVQSCSVGGTFHTNILLGGL